MGMPQMEYVNGCVGRLVVEFMEESAELEMIECWCFYTAKSFVFLTDRQWCSGRNHPSLVPRLGAKVQVREAFLS